MSARLFPARGVRAAAIVGVLLGAPVTAEYLQIYLTSTGRPLELIAGAVFLAPLYGGAALLIREAAVRGGLGWRGILLLATAFGLLMPSVVDLSLWIAHRADVAYWQALRGPTLVAALGFPVAPALSWTLGHVVFSIAAPLALLDGLAPSTRGRPLLSKVGIPLLSLGIAVIALAIRLDARPMADTPPTAGAVIIAVAVLLLIAAAWRQRTPRTGRPDPIGPASGAELEAAIPSSPDEPRAGREMPRQLTLIAAGAVATAMLGMWVGWLGVAVTVVLVAAFTIAVQRWTRRPGWGVPQVTALVTGALLCNTAMGFLSPLPPGVDPVARTIQCVIQLAGVAVICLVALRRSRLPSRSRAVEVQPS